MSTRSFSVVANEFLLYVMNRVISQVPFHSVRLWFYRTVMRFEIGAQSHVFMDAWFDCKGHFKMGANSVINQKCRLDNRGGITIGDNVSIAAEACLLTADHDPHCADFGARHAPIRIEDYAFVGTRAMILRGVRIGRGAVVAAGATVTKDVPEYSIVAGCPAKLIGTRSENLRYVLDYDRLFC